MTKPDKIKKAREKLGLSQTEVAEKVFGYTRQRWNDLEREPRNVTLLTLIEIAHALKVEPGDLVNWNAARRERKRRVEQTKD